MAEKHDTVRGLVLAGGGAPGMCGVARRAGAPEAVGTMTLCGCLVALSAFDLVQMRIPNGVLAVEIGETQGQAVKVLFEAAGLRDVRIHKDLGALDRAVSGVR